LGSEESKMNGVLDAFPIDGATVGSILGSSFDPEQVWLLVDIETLSDSETVVLGDLWRKVRAGPLRTTTRELCGALVSASQVVSLDLRLEADESIQLLIEDGVVVECHLS
jgi:hypothetical protein